MRVLFTTTLIILSLNLYSQKKLNGFYCRQLYDCLFFKENTVINFNVVDQNIQVLSEEDYEYSGDVEVQLFNRKMELNLTGTFSEYLSYSDLKYYYASNLGIFYQLNGISMIKAATDLKELFYDPMIVLNDLTYYEYIGYLVDGASVYDITAQYWYNTRELRSEVGKQRRLNEEQQKLKESQPTYTWISLNYFESFLLRKKKNGIVKVLWINRNKDISPYLPVPEDTRLKFMDFEDYNDLPSELLSYLLEHSNKTPQGLTYYLIEPYRLYRNQYGKTFETDTLRYKMKESKKYR